MADPAVRIRLASFDHRIVSRFFQSDRRLARVCGNGAEAPAHAGRQGSDPERVPASDAVARCCWRSPTVERFGSEGHCHCEFQSRDAAVECREYGLTGLFDALISTDANHSYKPEARAYRLGMDRLHLAKRDIVFAAFGGWDAAGAKSFGYPTFWVNRFSQPVEELRVRPDGMSTNLDGLLKFVLDQSDY